MSRPFDSFVLFAEMRTGSNFLEENLKAFAGVTSWGEAFNPHFVGQAGRAEMAGIDIRRRDAAPLDLLEAMRARSKGVMGFRFFHDHDPRILQHCLDDRRCAKVILTRPPIESYVSLQIARRTGQWRLGGGAARSARVRFDADDFARFAAERSAFATRLRRALQESGQAAFHLSYEEAGDLAVLNGLAAFLGLDGRIDALPDRTKVQNPGALRDKVENPEEMEAALAALDPLDPAQAPSFEPPRGANAPAFVAAAGIGLLYLPVSGAAEDAVRTWIGALGGAPLSAMSQKALRQWKRRHPGHRSVSVIAHPVVRAHRAFCRRILMPGPQCYGQIRETLRAHHGVPIPPGAPGADWSAQAHRAAFLAFLDFVASNLAGRTGLRVDGAWATQSAILQGICGAVLPDLVLREEEMGAELPRLAALLGLTEPPAVSPPDPDRPFALDAVLDEEIERRVRAIYQRDYVMFGFGPRAR